MKMYGYEFIRESDLAHYGLKGMHWGTRRWQDYSGKFNEAGYQRYFGRGTGENYHKVKKGSSGKAQLTSNSTNKGSSFDRDKAKKIAKGVAIGAAVVGGTVLVAYGAKKVQDLGGISKVSQDIVAKARETKIENLKLKEEFKTKLSSTKILQNYSGGSISSGSKPTVSSTKTSTKPSIPKLTLTPDLVNAGTNFLTQATKSYATISQINAQNSSSSSKVKQGQKAVDDYTRELLQRLS